MKAGSGRHGRGNRTICTCRSTPPNAYRGRFYTRAPLSPFTEFNADSLRDSDTQGSAAAPQGGARSGACPEGIARLAPPYDAAKTPRPDPAHRQPAMPSRRAFLMTSAALAAPATLRAADDRPL